VARRLTAPIAGLILAVAGATVGGAIIYNLDEGIREPEAESTEPWDRNVVSIVTAAAVQDAALWTADLLCRHPLSDAGERAPWTCDDPPDAADNDYRACCTAERASYNVELAPTEEGPATHYGMSTRATASYAAGLHVRLQADTAAQDGGPPRGFAALTEHPCELADAGQMPGDGGPMDPCAALPVPLVSSLDAFALSLGLVRVAPPPF
jgi:hypothetical protein